jgi:hypothetical protein
LNHSFRPEEDPFHLCAEENPPLREAAKALDEKFDALIAKAAGA